MNAVSRLNLSGLNNVDAFIKSGIAGGNVLEIGPGPGYVGLEWLKAISGSTSR